jgi:hypothetical protein
MDFRNVIKRGCLAVVLGVLLCVMLLAPFGVAPAIADGGSGGHPGTPPADSAGNMPSGDGDEFTYMDQSLMDMAGLLTTVRFATL